MALAPPGAGLALSSKRLRRGRVTSAACKARHIADRDAPDPTVVGVHRDQGEEPHHNPSRATINQMLDQGCSAQGGVLVIKGNDNEHCSSCLSSRPTAPPLPLAFFCTGTPTTLNLLRWPALFLTLRALAQPQRSTRRGIRPQAFGVGCWFRAMPARPPQAAPLSSSLMRVT